MAGLRLHPLRGNEPLSYLPPSSPLFLGVSIQPGSPLPFQQCPPPGLALRLRPLYGNISLFPPPNPLWMYRRGY